MKYIFLFNIIVFSFTSFAQNNAIKKQVYFASNSYELSQESLVTLFEIANLLKESPSYTMVLTGHTDNVGNVSANQKLSAQRVGAVKNYLLQLGLNNEWISADFFGANQPAVTNSSEEGKKHNRRVEVSVFYYPPAEPVKIKSEVVVPSHRQKPAVVEKHDWN